jgi:hypothetical protein
VPVSNDVHHRGPDAGWRLAAQGKLEGAFSQDGILRTPEPSATLLFERIGFLAPALRISFHVAVSACCAGDHHDGTRIAAGNGPGSSAEHVGIDRVPR